MIHIVLNEKDLLLQKKEKKKTFKDFQCNVEEFVFAVTCSIVESESEYVIIGEHRYGYGNGAPA